MILSYKSLSDVKKSGKFLYMRISKLGEGEIESAHRTERYVKLQIILFYVVNL